MQQDTFANLWRGRYWEQRESLYLDYLKYVSELYQFFVEVFEGRSDALPSDGAMAEIQAMVDAAGVDGSLRIRVMAYGSDELYERADEFGEAASLFAMGLAALQERLVEDPEDLAENMDIVLRVSYSMVVGQIRHELAQGHLYKAPASSRFDDELSEMGDDELRGSSRAEMKRAAGTLRSIVLAAANSAEQKPVHDTVDRP